MENSNLKIIERFFYAYGSRDFNELKQVLLENVKWTFPGQNPLSGEKVGIDELVEFFDIMGTIMGESNINVEKLVMGANDHYVIECQHIRTNRKDGINIDHEMCVLWVFEDGKIKEGKHFTTDQIKLDEFFLKVR